MEEKNEHKRVMVCLTFFGKIPRIATSRNCCIKMRQSWDFNPINFKSYIDIRLYTFEECPCGPFTPFRHWQKLHFFIFWHCVIGWGKYVCLPICIGSNSSRMFNSIKSKRAFRPSFVFTLMLRSVPIKLSHAFFLTCLTSIQCMTSNLNQYGR